MLGLLGALAALALGARAQADEPVTMGNPQRVPHTPPAVHGGDGPQTASAQRPRYTLEDVEIHGNARTRPKIILRFVPFHAGDVLDVADPEIELTRYRLL